MRRAAKVDANHKQVVEVFRKHGCSVSSLAAVGAGVPDLLVGYAGVTHLVEVKDGSRPPSQRKLTPAQVAFREAWKGEAPVTVSSTADAVLLVHRWVLAPPERTVAQRIDELAFATTPAPSQPEFDADDYSGRPPKVIVHGGLIQRREVRRDAWADIRSDSRKPLALSPSLIRAKGGA